MKLFLLSITMYKHIWNSIPLDNSNNMPKSTIIAVRNGLTDPKSRKTSLKIMHFSSLHIYVEYQ